MSEPFSLPVDKKCYSCSSHQWHYKDEWGKCTDQDMRVYRGLNSKTALYTRPEFGCPFYVSRLQIRQSVEQFLLLSIEVDG